MNHLRNNDYRSMPWKNGAGTTIEIAVWPDQAALDDFIWRVSRAQVVVDGGFSHFCGIDRSLALLQGQGMALQMGSTVLTLDQDHPVAVFAGDVVTEAKLIDGPINDLNVMSRRSRCSHRLSRWSGTATRAVPLNTTLLYCAQGSLLLAGGALRQTLSLDESLLFASDEPVTDYVLHCSDDSQIYCIQIFPREHE